MAKTAAERKREQRRRERPSGLVPERMRLDVMVEVRAMFTLRAYAEYKGITLGEAIEKMIKDFPIPHEESRAMWDVAHAKDEEERMRRLGDTRTRDLFA